jgi:hypothetical protein
MTSDSGTNVKHPLSRALTNRPKGPMRAPARALGWFSIGLGIAQLLMPRTVARAAGAPDVAILTRLCGLREVAVGIGLLTSVDPAPGLWGRVAGDALDMAAVAGGLVTARAPARSLASLAALGGLAYVDYQTACAAVPKRTVTGTAYDYSARSGFPKPPAEMRGAALSGPN